MAYRFRRGRGQFTAGSSRSGGAYNYGGRRVLVKGSGFELSYNGPAVMAALMEALTNAFSKLSLEGLQYMQSIVAVDTGELRDSCYVNVSEQGGRIRLEIGATARHAVYIELGTSSHTAQPYIRPTYDFLIQRLPGIIQSEVKRRGGA